MKISDYQERVNKWIEEYGVRYFNETTNMLILMEEVGELARLMSRKYGEQSFKHENLYKNVDAMIKDELADIMFVLSCLSNQMNIDLESALEENLSKKSKRDVLRHKQNKKLN